MSDKIGDYHFNEQERKALEECSIESFFYRSLPLASILGIGAHLAVKNGYLKPNAKFGSAPKVVIGIILGYLIGQASYQDKCAQKFMKIQDSEIGEILRKTRKR